MNKAIVWFVPPVLGVILIFLLSTVFSIPIQVEGVSGIDKWEHALAYFVLTYTFLLAFKRNSKLSAKLMVILLLSIAGYGVALELIQYTYFPDRYFEWLDAIANAFGVGIGCLIFLLLNKKNG